MKSLFAISPVCRAGMGLDVPVVFKGAAGQFWGFLHNVPELPVDVYGAASVDSPPGVEGVEELTFLVFDC